MEKLTRFELTRLLSARALQLSLGAPFLVDPKKGMAVNEIARLEYDKAVLPLIVLREYPDGTVKRIDVSKSN